MSCAVTNRLSTVPRDGRVMLTERARRFIGGSTDRSTDSRVRTRRFRCPTAPRYLVAIRTPIRTSPDISAPDRRTTLPPWTQNPSNAPSRSLLRLRDAADIVARTAADEADAIQARKRYRSEGLQAIEPDPEIRARLGPNEELVEMRPGAMVGRALLAGVGGRAADEGGAGTAPSAAQAVVESLSGRLYLTTARLVLLVRPTADGQTADRPTDGELSVGLADIEELACVGERLLVSLADGTGLTIDAGRPRLLRVQIAAARAAWRGEAQKADEELEGSPALVGLNPAALRLEA